MNKYELIYEAVQEAYDNEEITLEEAEFLNDYAYDKYITESTRLSREINDIHKDNNISKLDRYKKLKNSVKGNENTTSSDNEGYKDTGYVHTDSLGYGRGQSQYLKKIENMYGKNSEAYKKAIDAISKAGLDKYKTNQREVFNSENKINEHEFFKFLSNAVDRNKRHDDKSANNSMKKQLKSHLGLDNK